jgi:hypothetical protein
MFAFAFPAVERVKSATAQLQIADQEHRTRKAKTQRMAKTYGGQSGIGDDPFGPGCTCPIGKALDKPTRDTPTACGRHDRKVAREDVPAIEGRNQRSAELRLGHCDQAELADVVKTVVETSCRIIAKLLGSEQRRERGKIGSRR